MKLQYSTTFKRQLKHLLRRYRQVKKDIKPIIDALVVGETPGDQITGTGYTLYKVRAKNRDSQRGKSGGYRVIYYLKTKEKCILVTLYSKSEQGDISAAELKHLLSEIEKDI